LAAVERLYGATENARKRKCGTMKKQGVENAGKVACVTKLNQHKVNDKHVE